MTRFSARTALLALATLGGCGERAAAPPAPKAAASVKPVAPVVVDPEIAAFYHERGDRPLWVAGGALRPEALALARRIENAADDGLDPERYGAREVGRAVADAHAGDAQGLARAELLLSRSFAAFARDLRAAPDNPMRLIDPGLAPEPPAPGALLRAVAAARSLQEGVAAGTAMNPLYESLRRAHGEWLAKPGPHPAAEAAAIRRNLDRARAIPARAGRYVIVDAGSARLWMVDGDKVDGPMRVIVGKPGMQTPALAGLIRYVTLNPYWNMPPDLARERARKVLREGPGLLRRERLEILSDWGDKARPIPASAVDWKAVASGRKSLRLRQLPGGANVMGAVKFMLPNDLGIYLHDFPDKSLFARADRRLSSGCVRLEDAPRLARWLYRGAPPRPQGSRPEQNVDLPEPVPVYITYLTALPAKGGGIAFQPDAYGRDRPPIATRKPAPAPKV